MQLCSKFILLAVYYTHVLKKKKIQNICISIYLAFYSIRKEIVIIVKQYLLDILMFAGEW